MSLSLLPSFSFFFFFFNDTATTEIYTLSLHDALPILHAGVDLHVHARPPPGVARRRSHRVDRVDVEDGHVHAGGHERVVRSEEHTSELQSPDHLVCRLLLEKKNKMTIS